MKRHGRGRAQKQPARRADARGRARWFRGASLCVVGNINRDVRVGPCPAGERLLQDGETSVASITETIGGGGANSAFAARALGARVSFLGKVGVDPLGGRLRRTLERHGLEAHLAADPAHPTGTSMALSYDSGARHFLSCLPASEALRFEDLDLGAMDGFEHLLRADPWFSEAMLFGGHARLFEAAQQRGLAISVDLNWDPRWGRAGAEEIRARKAALRSVLAGVSLAHGNARELIEFADAADLETALRRLQSWGVEAVVVHLGAAGAGYYAQGSLQVEPPALVKRPLNTAGTGDVLSVCMMLLHRRTELSIRQRLRLANRMVAEYMVGRRDLIPELVGEAG